MPGAVLRVDGSKSAIQRFLTATRIKPHRVYLKGEPMSPRSAVSARHSYFLVMASNAQGDDFERQTREVGRFLKRHMKDLRALASHRLHAVIDFGVLDTRTAANPLLSWRFPITLCDLMTKAGVEAELSIYKR